MNAITRHELAQLDVPLVSFSLNGREVTGRATETLLQVAKREGVEIPHLCYMEGLEAVGNCRSCMVEINGERVLAPSCCRAPTPGMKVVTDSKRAVASQKLVLELLLSDMPEKEYTRNNEVDQWALRLGVGKPRFEARQQVRQDLSHPAIAVNLDACIQCTRCLRACRDEQVNDVIGLAFRGDQAKIVFDMDDPMGASTCVACGECVQACPTGALMPAREAALAVPDKQVASVCPYCGVGCQLTYNVKDDKILFVEGRDGPANHGRLCVKGRYGFDYAHHPQRLTQPLIRREGMPKTGNFTMDPDRVLDVFREASWEEALEFAGGKLAAIRDQHGKKSLAGFGSAKGSNEEAYSAPMPGAHQRARARARPGRRPADGQAPALHRRAGARGQGDPLSQEEPLRRRILGTGERRSDGPEQLQRARTLGPARAGRQHGARVRGGLRNHHRPGPGFLR